MNDVYTKLAATDHRLRLAQLGCSGETTATLVNGGICTYRGDHNLSGGVGTGHPAGSQLDAAVAFLYQHKDVSLITIDIGANDLNPCVVLPPSQIQACVTQVLPQIAANLSTIMTVLRRAGGSQVQIIGYLSYTSRNSPSGSPARPDRRAPSRSCRWLSGLSSVSSSGVRLPGCGV